MNSIVPYRRTSIYRKIGKYAWANRKRIYSGMKRGRKYVSRYRAAKRQKFGMSNIGSRVGTSNTKRVATISGNGVVGIQSKTLLAVGGGTGDVIDIAKQALDNDNDKRERDLINLRGIRICMEVRNSYTPNNPCYYNLALVHDKTNDATLSNDFFRALTGNDRSLDFATNGYSALFTACTPLNTDRWVILKHKRFLLGSPADTTRRSYFVKKMYIKIRRQLRFDLGATKPVDGQIKLLHWCDEFGSPAVSGIIFNRLLTNHNVHCYFRDTKC